MDPDWIPGQARNDGSVLLSPDKLAKIHAGTQAEQITQTLLIHISQILHETEQS
jgi:hypothetical protein